MKQLAHNFLKYLHSRVPLWVSRVYMPGVYMVRHLSELWIREYQVSGTLNDTNTVLHFSYFGNDIRILNYWIHTLFSETFRVQKKPGLFFWSIPFRLRNQDEASEFTLTEMNPISRKLTINPSGYILPRWVDTLLPVKTSLDALNNKKILKNIEKQGFSCRSSRSLEDLNFFYERMFRPYIRGRHGDASVMVDFSYFRKRMQKKDSMLFMLMKGDEPLVGSFNEKIKGRIKFSGLGVLDGRRDVNQIGAIRALYYFMLTFYREQGVEVIHYGGTSPLLSDGLTRFKRSLRAVPTDRKPFGEKSLLLNLRKSSPALHQFLKIHPFIFLKGGRFLSAFFPDASVLISKKAFLSWMKQNQFLGLSGIRIYCRTDHDLVSRWIKEENLPEVEVLPFFTD